MIGLRYDREKPIAHPSLTNLLCENQKPWYLEPVAG